MFLLLQSAINASAVICPACAEGCFQEEEEADRSHMCTQPLRSPGDKAGVGREGEREEDMRKGIKQIHQYVLRAGSDTKDKDGTVRGGGSHNRAGILVCAKGCEEDEGA